MKKKLKSISNFSKSYKFALRRFANLNQLLDKYDCIVTVLVILQAHQTYFQFDITCLTQSAAGGFQLEPQILKFREICQNKFGTSKSLKFSCGLTPSISREISQTLTNFKRLKQSKQQQHRKGQLNDSRQPAIQSPNPLS